MAKPEGKPRDWFAEPECFGLSDELLEKRGESAKGRHRKRDQFRGFDFELKPDDGLSKLELSDRAAAKWQHDLANELRLVLRELDLTQAQFADEIDASARDLGRWLNGEEWVNLAYVIRWKRFAGLRVEGFLPENPSRG